MTRETSVHLLQKKTGSRATAQKNREVSVLACPPAARRNLPLH